MAASTAARTSLANWPTTGRSSLDKDPSCFKIPVSSPFLPKTLTRSSSSSCSAFRACSFSSAFARICSSCAFMCFLPFKLNSGQNKSLRPLCNKGTKAKIPPRYHPGSRLRKKQTDTFPLLVYHKTGLPVTEQSRRSLLQKGSAAPLRRELGRMASTGGFQQTAALSGGIQIRLLFSITALY